MLQFKIVKHRIDEVDITAIDRSLGLVVVPSVFTGNVKAFPDNVISGLWMRVALFFTRA